MGLVARAAHAVRGDPRSRLGLGGRVRVDAGGRFVAGERGTEGAVTLCMCPICGEEIGVLDSVVMTDEGWSHKRCGRVTLADEGAAFVEPSAIGERIVRVATDMLAKVVDRAVAEERARNVASWVITEFDVKERDR